jgi:hypothetical protein
LTGLVRSTPNQAHDVNYNEAAFTIFYRAKAYFCVPGFITDLLIPTEHSMPLFTGG